MSRARNFPLLSSQFVYIGVLSDDFAAVDVREELCYHNQPKKQIQEVQRTAKTNGRKPCAAEKRQPIPKAVQRGRLRAAALSVWFSTLFVFVACACRGGAKRRRSRIKTVTYFYGQF